MKGQINDEIKEDDNMVKVETDVVVEDDEKYGLGNLMTKHMVNYLKDWNKKEMKMIGLWIILLLINYID